MQSLTTSLFAGLSGEEMARVAALLVTRRIAAGEIVIAEGERPRRIAIVQAGSAEIVIADGQGAGRSIDVIGPGSVIGEMSMLTGEPASATVRATTDLALLVLGAEEFEQAVAICPRIYQNLAAVLSQKLVRSNQRLLAGSSGVVMLHDDGAPPLLGYALACSIAWHSRQSVVLVIIGEGEGDVEAIVPGERDGELPRARLASVAGEGPFAPAALPSTIEDLRRRFHWVLVQAPPRYAIPEGDARHVALLPGDETVVPSGAEIAIRGWTEDSTPPDRSGIVSVAEFTAADEAHLERGRLPAASAAGNALGWAARHLCGLKVGLALGAGGAKGYGHIGVVRALRGLGLPVDYVTGSSIGACVASMVATELDTDLMATILDDAGAAAWQPSIPGRGILSSRRLCAAFQRIAGDRRIEELEIPLAMVAADIVSGREIVIRRGPVWLGMLASAAIPGIFPAQCVGPYTLVDGGVVNPVPSDVAARMGADSVIAVRLSRRSPLPPLEIECEPTDPDGGKAPLFIRTLMSSIEMMQSRMGNRESEGTLTIDLDFSAFEDPGLRHFGRGRGFIELGEAALAAAQPRLAATFPWLAHGQAE